jgi:Cu/Ag efflux protein CusF
MVAVQRATAAAKPRNCFACGLYFVFDRGQVVKVDQAAKKITIKHGPIPKLDMEQGMTMVFSTPDSNLLKTVKPGEKVNFDAERIGGQLVITKIKPTKRAGTP